MFSRDMRLRRERDIALVLRRGRAFRTPYFTLRFLATSLKHPRVTVVVGVATAKRATIRNRVKRQVRHILKAELSRVRVGVDLMVSVRPPMLKSAPREQKALLHEALRRVRIN